MTKKDEILSKRSSRRVFGVEKGSDGGGWWGWGSGEGWWDVRGGGGGGSRTSFGILLGLCQQEPVPEEVTVAEIKLDLLANGGRLGIHDEQREESVQVAA